MKAIPGDRPRPGWWSDAAGTQFHHYRDEEPLLVFLTVDDQRWRDVMNVASAGINELAEAHAAGLTGAD